MAARAFTPVTFVVLITVTISHDLISYDSGPSCHHYASPHLPHPHTPPPLPRHSSSLPPQQMLLPFWTCLPLIYWSPWPP